MASEKEIKLSASSLNLFLECSACFWLDKKWGIKRPEIYAYDLNLTVDSLLKEEFDAYRNKKEQMPVLVDNKINGKLFENQKLLNQWRNNLVGLRYFDENLQATLFGAIDDILEFPDGALAPLDYKSTAKPIAKVYDKFQLQMDVYAFLLEKNGFKISKFAYLAFYTVNKDKGFLDRLPFKKEIYEIKTNASEVFDIFKDAVEVLKVEKIPEHSHDCQFKKWLNNIEKFV